MTLHGRTAVITGAGQGLGKAIALAMAHSGADIVACDIQDDKLADLADEIEALGRACLPVRCDVSDRAAVDQMFADAADSFGTVHILVNNAALVPSSSADTARRNLHYAYLTTPMERRSLGITSSLTDEDWLRWWGVNVHGVFYCTRAALRCMEPQRYGRIINISSIAGTSAAGAHSPGYSAAKAAVASLTKTVALDVAGADILVNAIACGGVLTPPFQAYLDTATPEQKNSLYQLIPMGRLGTPEVYASLAVYLAGDNHYLTGQIISPNGGAVI
ncbi:SDR family NAD(P)-dependent oxidoreductase [Nocardia africana]|uniref:3-oxoacyl-[acyl-carrier-protein] reductase MabA n=1 Tax=Nocardia africana TaxID=134964 RepID=A0A378WY03_9NOCA|nr:SDR family NAD(P)-dependent oxidoreductase [Nocardia africana]MCC3312918.1 SDR family oxidoreductase [Nocardia africana]SUA45742.1 3-oxoacyl-[acyl-carrier-protein] reductase FabG [Nocardia africana]